jgi:hypothetical protein
MNIQCNGSIRSLSCWTWHWGVQVSLGPFFAMVFPSFFFDDGPQEKYEEKKVFHSRDEHIDFFQESCFVVYDEEIVDIYSILINLGT